MTPSPYSHYLCGTILISIAIGVNKDKEYAKATRMSWSSLWVLAEAGHLIVSRTSSAHKKDDSQKLAC